MDQVQHVENKGLSYYKNVDGRILLDHRQKQLEEKNKKEWKIKNDMVKKQKKEL